MKSNNKIYGLSGFSPVLLATVYLLTDFLTSSEQYFSFMQDKIKFNNKSDGEVGQLGQRTATGKFCPL